jgi:major vault protein
VALSKLLTRLALHLRAKSDFVDQTDTQRYTGDEWLYRQPGAYLPSIQETLVGLISPIILTDKKALHLQAVHHFVDE